jgi:mRNA-degrading endonuclease YafQ of YafQ-DinJ toxin-antitoxin module
MYKIETTSIFDKGYSKLIMNNKLLEKKILKTIEKLKEEPSYPGLKTHVVNLPSWGKVCSSWVTGDIRIIWKEIDCELILLLLDIGGHSGGAKVYK